MPHSALYLYLLMLSMATPISLTECPRTCECKWKSGKESVVCSNANFTTVPPNLDSGTQILDLTENHIANLKNQEFSQAGLVNLQKIFLARCRLKAIEKHAFKNLINLVELDLSFNLLSAVPSSSFASTPELRELKLSNNPIYFIASKAFSAVPQLVRLEMSGCKIAHIETESFFGLEDTLKWLKLDNNKLCEVEATAFTGLQNLHGLELAGNPWNCSCKLRKLREWMVKQNVPYDIPPICDSPSRLQDKSWKILELEEFACPPKIHANAAKAHDIEGANVTLSCSIEGIPRPHVKWLLRNRPIANTSSQATSKRLYIVNKKVNSSELVIQGAELQDAGTYTCAAENKAGKAEAGVSLTVSKKPSEIKFSTKVLLVSVLLGVTVTFLCCLLTVCFVSVRRKRLLKWHSPEGRREDNYEKIEMKPKLFQKNLNGGLTGEDGGLMTIARKNGAYSVVPGTDTDHENDEEEESTLEITTPGTSNEKRWGNDDKALTGSKSSPTTAYAMAQDARDNISRTCSSTYGTSKCQSNEVPSSLGWKTQPGLNTIYNTATSTRQVPDVIGHSSFGRTVSSRTQSENGSASDLSELFCTLPRKRDLGRYRSSDSQAALLPESRYGSDSSSDSFARRLSIEMQRHPMTKNSGVRSQLNLSRDERTLSSTPLLDVRGLEDRLSPHQQPAEPTGGGNPYDYHAAQLEKFLEEYRVLQKQLTKMKETCDSICQEQLRDQVSPCTAPNLPSGQLNNQANSPNSNSIQDSVDFKNFENELTRYLMSRSPSAVSNFATAALPNQNV